jgi:hypothetical protein
MCVTVCVYVCAVVGRRKTDETGNVLCDGNGAADLSANGSLCTYPIHINIILQLQTVHVSSLLSHDIQVRPYLLYMYCYWQHILFIHCLLRNRWRISTHAISVIAKLQRIKLK